MLDDLPPIPRNVWRRFGPIYGERRERMQVTLENEHGPATIVTCVERPERGTVWIEFCKLSEGGGIERIVSADIPESLAEELGAWIRSDEPREAGWVKDLLDRAQVPVGSYEAQGGGMCDWTLAGRVDHLIALLRRHGIPVDEGVLRAAKP